MVGPSERLAHVSELLPEICTLDCGTMNFALGDYVMTNTPSTLRAMAKTVQHLGVKPELEVFDTGHLVFVKQLIEERLLDDPCMIQLCLGIAYGAPDDPLTLMALVHQLPAGSHLQRFLDRPQSTSLCCDGRDRRPAMSGSGWKTICFLDRGVLASNGQLVERAATIVTAMGAARCWGRPRSAPN